MTSFEVNLITAFGRGRTLASALQARGFTVRVLDFTAAFSSTYARGTGPFPLPREARLPEQTRWLERLLPLERGLTFWLEDGPIELGSPMTPFFKATRDDMRGLDLARPSEFRADWLRRFLLQWASPLHSESWAVESGTPFSPEQSLGLMPSYADEAAMSFDELRAEGVQIVPCETVEFLQFEGSELSQIMVDAGQMMAFTADQWVWCLSSRETEIVNPEVAKRVFNKGIWRPEWSWVRFAASCEAGPWLEGMPPYTVLIGDVCLPWVYENATILRRLQPEGFHVWVKVPAKIVDQDASLAQWAASVERVLNTRLSLAKWHVSSDSAAICPHSPVFEAHHKDWGVPGHRNFYWIAPEVSPRIDFGARLEREAQIFTQLAEWRDEYLKKQGVTSDPALHAP